MNTTTLEGKLLVDIETGRVLQADAMVVATDRFLSSHPFIEQVPHTDIVFAGPDAARRAKARQGGNGEGNLDAIEYKVWHKTFSSSTLHLVK